MVAPFQEQIGWGTFKGRSYPVFIEGFPGLENGKLTMRFRCFLQVAPGEHGRREIRTKQLGPEVVPISKVAARVHEEWYRWKKEATETLSKPAEVPQNAACYTFHETVPLR
jgi:hypothetical protein